MRHGESEWNKEGRFTGWRDISLSEKGKEEAKLAGRALKENALSFSFCYTSLLKRAILSLWIILEEMDLMWVPFNSSWTLNERHYGALQGMKKVEVEKKFGKEQVFLWRRSYEVAPPPLSEIDSFHPKNDVKYKKCLHCTFPSTESLKQTEERLIPYWESHILRSLKTEGNVFIVAHGNSLRALSKYIEKISDQDISQFNIPTGKPFVYEFDENRFLLRKYDVC